MLLYSFYQLKGETKLLHFMILYEKSFVTEAPKRMAKPAKSNLNEELKCGYVKTADKHS